MFPEIIITYNPGDFCSCRVFRCKIMCDNTACADRCINAEQRYVPGNFCNFIITPAVMVPPLYFPAMGFR